MATNIDREDNVNVPARFDAFVLMDRMDDAAILKELEGQIVDTMVYHFRGGAGQPEVWGLSKQGVDEAAKQLALRGEVIRELDLTWIIDHDMQEAYFKVLAARFAVDKDGREVQLDSAWGTKRQSMQTDRRGVLTENPFWFEQGAMKAARNARARLIGVELKAEIIALAKQLGKVQPVQEPTTAPDINYQLLSHLDPFPFGKHSGVKIAAVPGGYLRSAIGLDDRDTTIDDDLTETLVHGTTGWLTDKAARRFVINELHRRQFETRDNLIVTLQHLCEEKELRIYEKEAIGRFLSIEMDEDAWLLQAKSYRDSMLKLVAFRQQYGSECQTSDMSINEALDHIGGLKQAGDRHELLRCRWNDERSDVRDAAYGMLIQLRDESNG